MAAEKSRSRFVESGVLQPPSPTADTQTLKKLEGGDYPFPLTQKSPEWLFKGYPPPSRSPHSSYSGTPALQLPEAKEPAMVSATSPGPCLVPYHLRLPPVV